MAVQFSSTQRAIAAGVASAGLLIGAFTLGAGQGSASPARASGATGSAALTAATAPAGARITVTGTGNVSGVPNQLSLSMGVQTNAGSVASALRQANAAATELPLVCTPIDNASWSGTPDTLPVPVTVIRVPPGAARAVAAVSAALPVTPPAVAGAALP